MTAKPATESTKAKIKEFAANLPFGDKQDYEDAAKGFLGTATERQIKNPAGKVVWDLDWYKFLDESCPDTANPSLWRQSQLTAKDGLFEVVPGIYQVMTCVEGKTGVIVIDPLVCKETAAAAFALYTKHRGKKPVTGMIYTHSHIDHFGGVKGIISEEYVESGKCPVIAPEGFMEHAVVENVYTGPAMGRRAGYMYGAVLEKGPCGQIGAGLGQTNSTGEATLIPPTVEIKVTGEELTVDGVQIVFQMTPGTEAPAEMNFYFPQHRAVCAAENACHTLHNILTIRGAVVRDAHAWAHYLTETITLWGDKMDVVFASHHWPTWGQERCVTFLSDQRDMYLYLHDQTLRMINLGFVGSEISEQIQIPPKLAETWHTHGYYGTISHNVKAIYQRYMGWYEGNPARLWQHPPEESAKRYVKSMGGADKALAEAQAAYDSGDYRWAAQVLDHIIFADAKNAKARALQADTFEQLGYYAESGTWRSAYLAGATELRSGNFGTPLGADAPDIVAALSIPQLLDTVAIRINGPRAWSDHFFLSWNITDHKAIYVMELRNGVLNHKTADAPAKGSPVFTLTKNVLTGLLTGMVDPEKAVADGLLKIEGDGSKLATLLSYVDAPNPKFNIIEP